MRRQVGARDCEAQIDEAKGLATAIDLAYRRRDSAVAVRPGLSRQGKVRRSSVSSPGKTSNSL
jgi:hypothetical protein